MDGLKSMVEGELVGDGDDGSFQLWTVPSHASPLAYMFMGSLM